MGAVGKTIEAKYLRIRALYKMEKMMRIEIKFTPGCGGEYEAW